MQRVIGKFLSSDIEKIPPSVKAYIVAIMKQAAIYIFLYSSNGFIYLMSMPPNEHLAMIMSFRV